VRGMCSHVIKQESSAREIAAFMTCAMVKVSELNLLRACLKGHCHGEFYVLG